MVRLNIVIGGRAGQGINKISNIVSEIMINQGLVRELILKGEIGKIHDVMEQNNSIGMQTFDQSLMRLFVDDKITEDTAITNSDRPSDMKIKVEQAKLVKQSGPGDRSGLETIDTSRIYLSE